MLLATLLEPKACARTAPPGLALSDEGHLDGQYLDRLMLFRTHRLTLTWPVCTLVHCRALDGTPVECCNTCREGILLSGFPHVPLILPDGDQLDCDKRKDCDPPSCLDWLKPGKELEIAGSFRAEKGQLEFVLARDPKRWLDRDVL